MLLNKTVFLEGGGTQICEYDTDDLRLSGLWISVFVLSAALNLFAIFGNCIVVLACFLQKKKPPLIVYIHALALSDLFYALVAPLYTYRYVLQHWPSLVINFGLAGRLSHSVTLIGNTFSSISSWLVVALTLDRLILTKLPFKAGTLSTSKRAYLVILTIVLCCCSVNAVWVYEFLEVPITVLPCNGYWIIPNEVERDDGSIYTPIRYRKAYQLYAIISAVLFLYALPTLIIIVSNTLVILALKTSNPASQKLVASAKATVKRLKEIRLTKMIIVVSITFVISNVPDVTTRLLWKFISPLIVAKVQPIAHLFLMINVGANFIVYSMFNKHLFDTIISLCRPKKCCLRPNAVAEEVPSSSGSKFPNSQSVELSG
ncbi:somatostatin receptor type 4-like [Watersipora subatra]|uniref:somatostatin receptor type 4-like n=1 Tax=Watersipora subatra TaxID=2589382 RepID=UPI00355B458D